MWIDLTGWTSLVIAVTALIPAVISLMAYLETRHNTRQLARSAIEVEKVHEIVNSQRTKMEDEIGRLKEQISHLYERLDTKKIELSISEDRRVNP